MDEQTPHHSELYRPESNVSSEVVGNPTQQHNMCAEFSPEAPNGFVTCEYPHERDDGTLCGFEAESIVDVVRSEGRLSSTFFTLPMCLGHRLALGRYVITFEPIIKQEAQHG